MKARSPQRTFAVAATIGLLLIVFLYGLFEARRFLTGPVLSIETPLPGSRVPSVVTLRGVAQNISFITLNGRQIFVDDGGVFAETLTPAKGYTVLTVEVRDRFGRTKREELPIVIE